MTKVVPRAALATPVAKNFQIFEIFKYVHGIK